MCMNPYHLSLGVDVACKQCWQCQKARVNDLVGRCLAEMARSSCTLAVTLTYAGDVPESALLRYRDIQLFLKRLRFAGFKVRYICAGEYGSRKGRAHWHIVLFFRGKKRPDVPINSNIAWEYWPHGFSYFQRAGYEGFAYLMKYALKDSSDAAHTRHLAMSKKPPLGHDFFMDMADDIVEAQLPMQMPCYSFQPVRDRKGKIRRFSLRGRMKELMCDRYRIAWALRWGGEPPESDWYLEAYADKVARERPRAMADTDAAIEAKRPREPHIPPNQDVFGDARVVRGYMRLRIRGAPALLVAFADGSGEINCGDEKWLLESGPPEIVGRQLSSVGVVSTQVQPVCQWLLDRWSLLGT